MNISTKTTIERRKVDQKRRNEANPKSPVDSLRVSDSFTQCLIEARKQNLKTNDVARESNEGSDSVHTVEDDNNLRMKNSEGKHMKTKMKLESTENRKSECDFESEEFGKENAKFKKLKGNNLDESVNIPNEVTTISGRTSLPLERCRETPTAVSTSANISNRSESGLKVVCSSSSAIAQSKNQIREPSIPNNNSSKKRRLYSSENNTNVKDLVMSSQEDFSLEVPKYKIANEEPRAKPQLGVSRANISYSYITQNQKGKQVISSNSNKIYSDCHDSVEEVLSEEITMCPGAVNSLRSKESKVTNLKKDAINDKKLRALNKTPESTKASKIFKSHSVYSDLSSPDKKKPVKRTYTRPKRQKRFKKIQLLDDSSDSEYEPPYKISPEYIEPREKKTRSSIPTFKGFVDQLQHERIDPIRDHTHTDDMEIRPVCLEDDEMENPNLTMRVRSLQVATTTISKVCKRKKTNPVKAENVKAPKKPVNRKTKAAQSKKPEVKTSQEDVEKMPEGMALEPPLLFGSANCKFTSHVYKTSHLLVNCRQYICMYKVTVSYVLVSLFISCKHISLKLRIVLNRKLT